MLFDKYLNYHAHSIIGLDEKMLDTLSSKLDLPSPPLSKAIFQPLQSALLIKLQSLFVNFLRSEFFLSFATSLILPDAARRPLGLPSREAVVKELSEVSAKVAAVSAAAAAPAAVPAAAPAAPAAMAPAAMAPASPEASAAPDRPADAGVSGS